MGLFVAGSGCPVSVVLMTVYVVTGRLGAGKTLCAVGRIRDKLRAGCIVATNLDLRLHKLLGPDVRDCRVLRIPDKPARSDLDAIGIGNTRYDEDHNGLLVLDELGTWFNSRGWQDKSRAGVIDWFLHARKLGWDLILIIQHIDLMDSQARVAIAEMLAVCRRIDRISIPVIGSILKLFWGERVPLPRVHIASVRYGTEHNALIFDRWVYRGTELFAAYDTRQVFLEDYQHGVHSVLPPWYTHGRYKRPRTWEWYMRMTRIVWRRFSRPTALAAGVALGVLVVGGVAVADLKRSSLEHRAAAKVWQDAVDAVPVGSTAAAQPVPAVLAVPDALGMVTGVLAGRRIVGYVQQGARYSYLLGVPGSGDMVTSDDLRAAGYSVSSGGPCRVTVRRGHDAVLITCVDDPVVI